ncbi:MAG: hypothetical protein QOE35_4059 [Actinomycetota bacterium]
MSRGEDADEQVDALYGLPLSEFVAARNALAKERKDAALKKLPKPTATAWALNQLARHAPDDVESLLAAARKVGETQAGAVRGRGSAPFKEAVQAERDALAPLVTRARQLVRGESQVLKVADALRAAASDPALHDELRAGRLTEEPVAGGFGGGFGLGELGGTGASTSEEDDDAERAAEQEARAERERREREQAADKAEQEADRLEARATDAEQRAAQLRAEAHEARSRAREARAGVRPVS